MLRYVVFSVFHVSVGCFGCFLGFWFEVLFWSLFLGKWFLGLLDLSRAVAVAHLQLFRISRMISEGY